MATGSETKSCSRLSSSPRMVLGGLWIVIVGVTLNTINIYRSFQLDASLLVAPEDRNDSPVIAYTNTTTAAARGQLFLCGWPLEKLRQSLFPEYTNNNGQPYYRNSTVSSNDLLLMGMHGPCDGYGRKYRVQPNYLEEHFPGKVLLVNGEPFGNLQDYTSHHHLYQIGLTTPHQHHTVRMFYIAVVFYERYNSTLWNWIIDPNQRPRWNGKFAKVLYMSGRCATHRQQAAANLSTILPIDFGSKCTVPTPNGTHLRRPSHQKLYPTELLSFFHTDETYWDNWFLYRHYKYCLCMEKVNRTGYISEKILIAFLGGCLPIYWGTTEIYELFHPDAFLFYNFDHPELTLQEIQYLESNETAYQERLKVPILRNGSQTIQDYFSLGDDLGGGKLKNDIRRLLGL